ncbi:hypothetical protein [Nocardioides sp. URHA0020]|uniref:hypothetical protein n=1 Tax=Nocardioides sp. URHA0020 TaxID=1380392 RepID=UPI0012DF692D|nr:hypothetical protein [Nocardioides sp. URHA0020]
MVTRVAGSVAATMLVVGLAAAPATGERADFGRTTARSGTLHRGCHDYRYDYRVTPPTDDWALETFLRDPRRERIASGMFLSDSDPAHLRSHFRVCRYSTRPGTFTVRALLHWYTATGDEHQIWLEPTRFRLRRP